MTRGGFGAKLRFGGLVVGQLGKLKRPFESFEVCFGYVGPVGVAGSGIKASFVGSDPSGLSSFSRFDRGFEKGLIFAKSSKDTMSSADCNG